MAVLVIVLKQFFKLVYYKVEIFFKLRGIQNNRFDSGKVFRAES